MLCGLFAPCISACSARLCHLGPYALSLASWEPSPRCKTRRARRKTKSSLEVFQDIDIASSFTASRRMSLESAPVDAWKHCKALQSRFPFTAKDRVVMVARCRACLEGIEERFWRTCQVVRAPFYGNTCWSRPESSQRAMFAPTFQAEERSSGTVAIVALFG